MNKQGHTTKTWKSAKGQRGGKPWTPKYVHRILTNPIYIGKISHKENLYKGMHQALITLSQWKRVQDQLSQSTSQEKRICPLFPLKKRITTEEGITLSPSQSKNVRYYVSQKALKYGYASCNLGSINAELLENLVMAYALDALPSQRVNDGF